MVITILGLFGTDGDFISMQYDVTVFWCLFKLIWSFPRTTTKSIKLHKSSNVIPAGLILYIKQDIPAYTLGFPLLGRWMEIAKNCWENYFSWGSSWPSFWSIAVAHRINSAVLSRVTLMDVEGCSLQVHCKHPKDPHFNLNFCGLPSWLMFIFIWWTPIFTC